MDGRDSFEMDQIILTTLLKRQKVVETKDILIIRFLQYFITKKQVWDKSFTNILLSADITFNIVIQN